MTGKLITSEIQNNMSHEYINKLKATGSVFIQLYKDLALRARSSQLSKNLSLGF